MGHLSGDVNEFKWVAVPIHEYSTCTQVCFFVALHDDGHWQLDVVGHISASFGFGCTTIRWQLMSWHRLGHLVMDI